MLQLVNVISEYLKRFYVSRHRCSHRLIRRGGKIPVFFQQFVPFISPPQDDVSFPSGLKHLLVKPVLSKSPQKKIQLEIMECLF
jgi:membrane protein DedA with SNARE-associated domain